MNTKQQILALLAEGMSTAEIAKKLGVSQRTIQRWTKQKGVNPVKEVLDEVIKTVACSVEAELGDELKTQALQLLRLSGKSLNCLEEIIDDPHTRKADRLKACQIVGEWVGMRARTDIATHTLNNFGLEIAITPYGEKTLQEHKKSYPLERDYEIVKDNNGSLVAIRKRLQRDNEGQ